MRLFRSFRWLLLALVVTIVPLSSEAGVFISVGFAPPELPVYVQPVCPEPGLLWIPGYWAYGEDGYYWVPGAWVPSPYVGALWTPGYWGWSDGLFVWHAGYWGPHVGYYGGVNYGYGYGGIGFAGGEWRGGVFAYNTAVVHVGAGGGWGGRVYEDRTIVNRTTIVNNTHVSYNGGPGGINHQPAPEERLAEREQHVAPTSFQAQHENTFRNDHTAYATVNGGHPQNAAIARPLGGENHSINNQNPGINNETRVNNNANRGNGEANQRQVQNQRQVENQRPIERNETVNRSGQGNPRPNNAGNPHPENAVAPHPAANPAPRAETRGNSQGQFRGESRPAPSNRPAPANHPAPAARPAPQAQPKPEKEHKE